MITYLELTDNSIPLRYWGPHTKAARGPPRI